MALFQETSGKPILGEYEPKGIYAPAGSNPLSQMLIDIVQEMEPRASAATVVGIIKDARKKYAGKRMRFIDFFPGYGLTIRPIVATSSRAAA